MSKTNKEAGQRSRVHSLSYARDIEVSRVKSPKLTFEQHCWLADQILKDKDETEGKR